MANSTQELATSWNKRIEAANRYHKKWAEKYEVNKLEEFYYGDQWPNTPNYKPYVLNLVFSAIETQLPSRVFSSPVYAVKPRPSSMDFNLEIADQKARFKEDVLNFWAQDPEFCLAEESTLAILDAFFQFGIIEVGFSADYLINPNLKKPAIQRDEEPGAEEGEVADSNFAEKILEKEKIFVKRIPAGRFRVGGIDHQNLKRCSWCGYWEFVRIDDLLANDNIKNKDAIKSFSISRTDDFMKETLPDEIDEMLKEGDVTVLWHLWDQRSRMFHLKVDLADEMQFSRPYERLPLFALKYSERLRGFYPLPPVFNWMGPQREYNESHEMHRVHRRRFVRKFLKRQGAFPEGEFEKLMDGGDGSSAEVTIPVSEAVKALDNPQVGSDVTQSMQVSKEDFYEISGSSPEMRGLPSDRQTATQSTIIESRSKIRESRPKEQIAAWLNDIGKEILMQAAERLTLPFWIQSFVDSAQDFGEIVNIQGTWNLIDPNVHLDDGEDFDVTISVSSLSPVTNEAEKQKFIEFLSVLSKFPMISMSPTLVRETADRLDYRNQKVIGEMQKMAAYVQMAQMGGGPQNQAANNKVAQMTPPAQEQIQNQLENQLG